MATSKELASKIAELERQLEAARKEADTLRAHERATIIADINERIAEHGIAAHELTFPRAPKGKKAPATRTTKIRTGAANPPKYRNPESGQTWTGRGQPPGWIKDAPDRDVYLIKE